MTIEEIVSGLEFRKNSLVRAIDALKKDTGEYVLIVDDFESKLDEVNTILYWIKESA